jgi:hypothetical protein
MLTTWRGSRRGSAATASEWGQDRFPSPESAPAAVTSKSPILLQPPSRPPTRSDDLRLVRPADAAEGPRAHPHVVLAHLPATSLGAVTGRRLRPRSSPGRRAARGGPHPYSAEPARLEEGAQRPRRSARRRPYLRPGPPCPGHGTHRGARRLHPTRQRSGRSDAALSAASAIPNQVRAGPPTGSELPHLDSQDFALEPQEHDRNRPGPPPDEPAARAARCHAHLQLCR